MRAVSSQHGGVLVVVVVISAALLALILWAQSATTQTLRYVTANAITSERYALRKHLNSTIDCKRMMAPYNKTNHCPVGKQFPLWFFNRTVAEPNNGPNASTLLFPSWPGNHRKWAVRVTCGTTSLNVQSGLWDATTSKFVNDPLTGKPLNLSAAAPSRMFGDDPREQPFCAENFGAKPSGRIVTMDMVTGQKLRFGADAAGKYNEVQSACDGTAGYLADILLQPGCHLAANPAKLTPFCVDVANQFDVQPKPNPACTAHQRSCLLSVSPSGHLFAASQCSSGVCARQNYRGGAVLACKPAALPLLGLGVVKPDVSTGQLTCFCMD